jgi:hypothetical protein
MLEVELLERDRWSRDHLLAHQEERVRALIRHAVSKSPYYREALGADAVERPLAELPTLSKATLMAEFDRVVTDQQLRLADLRAHLSGSDPSQSFLGDIAWRRRLARPAGGQSWCLRPMRLRHGARSVIGP